MNWNQLGSADPPLAVHCLYRDRHCQLHRPGTGEWDASALGDLLAVAPARLAPVHRAVYVRPAVCRQVAPREENMKTSDASQDQSASALISNRIAELGDWRGKTLRRMRTLIKKADPDVVEEWKWVKASHARHSGLVARRHHLHRRVLQECREADLRQGRVSEGSGPSLQLESRRKRTPRYRHSRRRRG